MPSPPQSLHLTTNISFQGYTCPSRTEARALRRPQRDRGVSEGREHNPERERREKGQKGAGGQREEARPHLIKNCPTLTEPSDNYVGTVTPCLRPRFCVTPDRAETSRTVEGSQGHLLGAAPKASLSAHHNCPEPASSSCLVPARHPRAPAEGR